MKQLNRSITVRLKAGVLVSPNLAPALRQRKPLVVLTAALAFVAALMLLTAASAESGHGAPTLMTMVFQWRYPEAKISRATLSDAATVDVAGQRTCVSAQYKAVFSTKDAMAKVIAYYEKKLKRGEGSETAEPGKQPAANSGKSVISHDDSEGRPVGIHVICVNADKTSTTLVVSRAATESETHVAWALYQRF